MTEIVARTPLWVWALLVALIGLGLFQMQARETRRIALLLPALGFSAYSLSGILRGFAGDPVALLAWLLGFSAVLALVRPSIRASISDTLRDLAGRVSVAGSILPLALYLGIFTVNYALNVLKATKAPLLTHAMTVAGFGVVLGLFSGLLMHRALRNAAGLR